MNNKLKIILNGEESDIEVFDTDNFICIKNQLEPKRDSNETENLYLERINSAFIKKGNTYRDKSDNDVFFKDAGKLISTKFEDQKTVKAMLDLAESKGWESINIKGTEKFKALVAKEANKRNIQITNYSYDTNIQNKNLKTIDTEKFKIETSSSTTTPIELILAAKKIPPITKSDTLSGLVIGIGTAKKKFNEKNADCYYVALVDEHKKINIIWDNALKDSFKDGSLINQVATIKKEKSQNIINLNSDLNLKYGDELRQFWEKYKSYLQTAIIDTQKEIVKQKDLHTIGNDRSHLRPYKNTPSYASKKGQER